MNARKNMTDLRLVDRPSAEKAFGEMAHLNAELTALETEYEQALLELKEAFTSEKDALERAIAHYEQKLDAFILSNPNEFKKPRSIRTIFGEFGMRNGTKTHIADKAKALADCEAQGFTDCVKVTKSLKIKELRNLLETKPDVRVAGVSILRGDVTFHKLDRVFLDRAVAQIASRKPNPSAEQEPSHAAAQG